MHEHSTTLDDAALYALGMLTSEERAAFEAALGARAEDDGVAADLVDIVAALSEARADAAAMPRAAVRAAVLARATGTPRSTVVRGADDTWQNMAPGITMKSLSFDARTGMHSLLVRLAAGAAYPPHRHVGDEQCFVLEGELVTDDLHLRGGDFIATTDGTVHTDTHSDTGCLLLLTTRMADEFVA